MSDGNPDPKGLIRESYRIDGIAVAECRSIFLDWAIGVPAQADPRDLISELLGRYSPEAPDHPMTKVLQQGLEAPDRTGRRGGRQGRTQP